MADIGQKVADLLDLPARNEPRPIDVLSAFIGRYDQPTDLQDRVFDEVYAGLSCLVIAPTAAGKTEAAVMPLVARQRLLSGLILYVTPTKALINDILERLAPGFGQLGLVVLGRHGDRRHTDAAYYANACVVITPESVEVALEANSQWIERVQFVVLDELHSLDRSPRGLQLRCLLTRLAARLTVYPQVVALSATVVDEASMAGSWGQPGSPLRVVRTRGSRTVQLSVRGSGSKGIRTYLTGKRSPAKVLIFANSRNTCDELFLELNGATDHVPLIHYSDLDRSWRHDVEELLRRLPRVACITTSTLELGIDVGDIDAVVLADPPWSTLSALQRIGRGNRREETARGVAFVNRDRALLRTIAAFDLEPNQSDDDGFAPTYFSVVVQQTMAILAGNKRRRVQEATVANAFRASAEIDRQRIHDIFGHLVSTGVLVQTEARGYFELAAEHERLLGREHWGNYPVDQGGWELKVSGRTLARVRLPTRPTVGHAILFAGHTWRITSIRGRSLDLVDDPGVATATRVIYSEPAPLVSGRLGRRMAEVLASGLPTTIRLDDFAKERWVYLREWLGPTIGKTNVQVPGERGWKTITFAGGRANRLLALALPDAIGSDEVGIETPSQMTDAKWSSLRSVAIDPVAIQRSADGLASGTSRSSWFEFLPDELKRAEVASQFVGNGVFEQIERVLQLPIQTLPGVQVTL